MSINTDTVSQMITSLPDNADMTAILEKAERLQPGETLFLRGIEWQEYQSLLVKFANQSSPRLAYNNGVMEIMSPRLDHEQPNRMLQDLVTIISDELAIEILNCGSTTFTAASLQKGVEPDTCFYIANEAKIRDKDTIDLMSDPPPDLVIEIDVTSPSLDKFPIYAAMNVPEIWRYTKQEVAFYHLGNSGYQRQATSANFPFLQLQDVMRFLNACAAIGQ